MPLSSKMHAMLKSLELKSGPLKRRDPRIEPCGDLDMMKELVAGFSMDDASRNFTELLSPFLQVISLEDWHLLVVYAWSELLGPVECKLWTKSGQLYTLCKTKGQGMKESKEYAAKAEAYQNSAFTPPPPVERSSAIRYDPVVNGWTPDVEPSFGLVEDSPVFPMFDAARNGMSTEQMLKYVVAILVTLIRKRETVEQIEKALGIWEAAINRRDSASA